ncbi:hypothetical protein ES288_A08G059300v1 [Gossypium darwinii]|uniref:Uncharacterized protein n=2 Tax=Gossypium TaxID=3633 RepID=A0A5D2PDV2_GOSTO|nr:hypothetical protein ES288_A08G059300v1 [Gossypium darwinii]TYI13494.1 hypothetical protein ES332_A08G061200v1 [Gossypium tomentosum]
MRSNAQGTKLAIYQTQNAELRVYTRPPFFSYPSPWLTLRLHRRIIRLHHRRGFHRIRKDPSTSDRRSGLWLNQH